MTPTNKRQHACTMITCHCGTCETQLKYLRDRLCNINNHIGLPAEAHDTIAEAIKLIGKIRYDSRSSNSKTKTNG